MLSATTNYAQERNIQLVDQSTQKPIENVSYKYGKTKGLSDESGLIRFTGSDNKKLVLSHLQYGILSFEDDQIKKQFKTERLS